MNILFLGDNLTEFEFTKYSFLKHNTENNYTFVNAKTDEEFLEAVNRDFDYTLVCKYNTYCAKSIEDVFKYDVVVQGIFNTIDFNIFLDSSFYIFKNLCKFTSKEEVFEYVYFNENTHYEEDLYLGFTILKDNINDYKLYRVERDDEAFTYYYDELCKFKGIENTSNSTKQMAEDCYFRRRSCYLIYSDKEVSYEDVYKENGVYHIKNLKIGNCGVSDYQFLEDDNIYPLLLSSLNGYDKDTESYLKTLKVHRTNLDEERELSDEDYNNLVNKTFNDILDCLAKELKYDNFETCLSYINSTNPNYKKDAELLNRYRDYMWETFLDSYELYNLEVEERPFISDILVKIKPFEEFKCE